MHYNGRSYLKQTIRGIIQPEMERRRYHVSYKLGILFNLSQDKPVVKEWNILKLLSVS